MSTQLTSGRERFHRRQVLRILGISERQLASWERQGLVRPCAAVPAAADGQRPAKKTGRGKASGAGDPTYTFSDLVTLRTLLHLRRKGVPPARIRMAHAALQRQFQGVQSPWSELQVQARGKRVMVRYQGATMEPLTGQLDLPYSAAANRAAVVRPLVSSHRDVVENQKLMKSERLFRAALRYEEQGDKAHQAIRAYQRAIELNGQAVGAFVNLGTLYYKLGRLQEAEGCYRTALSIQPGYALVEFNLGNVFDERCEWEKARQHYEESIRLDPNYPDPRFNLALVYEKLGMHGKACGQWRSYLKLDAESRWALYARQQLESTPLHLIVKRPSEPTV